MKVSVNTAVFVKSINEGKSQYDCLTELVGKPIDHIEVRGELFKEETKDTELENISKLCSEQNWGFFYSIPEELFTDGKLNSHIFENIEMAEKFNIKGLKISLGSFKELNDENLGKLTDVLNDSKVRVTVENQPNDNGVLSTFENNLREFLKSQPKIGYTFDSGNWYWIAEKPETAFHNLKELITVFHLKDILNKTTVMLNEGDSDWKMMAQELNSDIPVFLEYEIDDDQLDIEIEKVNSILN